VNEHLLDRPVWASLNSVNKGFSVGSERALRFHPEIGPLAGIQDESPESLSELEELLETYGSLAVGQSPELRCPKNARITAQHPAVQMMYEERDDGASMDAKIASLTACDAPLMYALAKLTNPGPFARRTHELGQFWGIKCDDQLVAMAGERLKTPEYIEVSGVCTDPQYQNRGFGRALCLHVCIAIRDKGCQPFLHVYEDNDRAIGLYASMGFVIRSKITVTVLEHLNQSH
jgi:predicted GNAT family acetyltransferase